MKKYIIFLCLVILLPNNCSHVKAEEGVAGISATINHINYTEKWTTTNVNLRNKPNTNAEIITTLKTRTKVQIISQKEDWSMVIFDSKTGWICTKYLRDTEEPILEFTNKEKEMLYRITEAEATGKSITAKENVVSCIINRVYSADFPDTIKEVIFQKVDGNYQFSPVADKRYWKVEITEETKQAVDNVIKNGVTHDALYFCNYNTISSKQKKWFDQLNYCFSDDVHNFYK